MSAARRPDPQASSQACGQVLAGSVRVVLTWASRVLHVSEIAEAPRESSEPAELGDPAACDPSSSGRAGSACHPVVVGLIHEVRACAECYGQARGENHDPARSGGAISGRQNVPSGLSRGENASGAQHALMHGDQGNLLFLAKLLIGADGCLHVGQGRLAVGPAGACGTRRIEQSRLGEQRFSDTFSAPEMSLTAHTDGSCRPRSTSLR
jgi:hypothetical protein